MTNTAYDGVVIGGGHNGLIAACYLARGGKKVCLLERRHVLGGCSVTEELWPGYKVSTASYVVSLLLPEIIAELKLKQYGLNIMPRNPSSFTPMADGRHLMLGPDATENRKQIAKFSERDAQRYGEYEAMLERVAAVLEPLLMKPAPDLLPLPKSWRRIGWSKRLRDLNAARQMHAAVKRLGTEIPEAIELLTGAARPILERWFETEVLRATIATDAIIGAFRRSMRPGPPTCCCTM